MEFIKLFLIVSVIGSLLFMVAVCFGALVKALRDSFKNENIQATGPVWDRAMGRAARSCGGVALRTRADENGLIYFLLVKSARDSDR